jgi:hypothetical protein
MRGGHISLSFRVGGSEADAGAAIGGSRRVEVRTVRDEPRNRDLGVNVVDLPTSPARPPPYKCRGDSPLALQWSESVGWPGPVTAMAAT